MSNIQNLLTLDIKNSKPKAVLLPLVDSTAIPFGPNIIGCPMRAFTKSHSRVPWDLIPDEHFKGMNFMININPDPNCDWYTSHNDKDNLIPRMISLIQESLTNSIIKKATIVYEYGKFGKEHGKLHFHGLVSTTKKQELQKNILKQFNSKKNLSHITLQIKHVKSPVDRQRYLNYMKKESQNKTKCLYTTHTSYSLNKN